MKRMGTTALVQLRGPVRTGVFFLSMLFAGLAPRSVMGTGNDTIHLREVAIVRSFPVPYSPLISGSLDTLSLELIPGQSLGELLAFQPAVYIRSTGRGALATASFRGTSASHTKVYWNGIKLNSPMLGQVDFSQIPVWVTDEVSILYGGSSLAEGGGALGGAILLENKVKWKKDVSLSLNQEISSFGTLGTQGRLSAGNRKFRTETRLYRNRSLNDYPFLNTDVLPVEVQRLERAAYKRGGVLQEICLRPGSRQELALRLWYQEAGRDLPPLMSQEGSAREEKQSDRNLRTSMEWKFNPGSLTLSLRSGFSGSRMHYLLNYEDLGYRQFETKSVENSLYNTVKADLRAGSSVSLYLRADYNRHDAGISDLVRSQGYRHLRNEGGITVSARADAGRGLVLYALLRQEWADGKWLPFMPSTGFSYRPLEKTRLYIKGNLARNYNLPSLNDLYWVPGGNPGLRPENSLNGDLSVEFLREGRHYTLKTSVNMFAADVRDWILWKPTKSWPWEAQNIAHVFSRGLDFQLGPDFYLGEWIFSLRTGYAYTRSTNQGSPRGNDLSRGGQLIYIPVHASSSFLNITRKGYFMSWSICSTGRRYTQPSTDEYDYTESLNPYTLVDLHTGKSWKIGPGRAGIRFSVYNLFKVSYQAVRSRPMPMRSYAIILNIEL